MRTFSRLCRSRFCDERTLFLESVHAEAFSITGRRSYILIPTSEQARVGDKTYFGYEHWKKWPETFRYTKEDGEYFSGELRGLRLRGAAILEIGFGSGNFLAWAIEQGARVAGTEINGRSLKLASDKGIELLNAEIEDFPERHAGRFDTIVAFDVFEHFEVDVVRRRLEAANTLLTPNGALLLRFPNSQSPFGLSPQNGDPTHRSALSRSAIEQLMQGTSFRVERYTSAFRIGGGSLGQKLARRVRALMRDAIASILNFIYTQSIPWDPVVVIVLRKTGKEQAATASEVN